MRKETIILREKWVAEKWNEYKNKLSMKDLSEIFGISIGNVYRILKKEQIKEYEKPYNPKVADIK